MDVDAAERHLAGEVQRHHDHPRDPEEDDVEAGHEHGRRQEQILFDRFCRPAERRKRELRGRVPGVEHVGVAGQRAGVAGGRGFGARLFFVAADENLAAAAVPRGNLVAPPQLARDAPVLDVAHPVVPGVDPLRRHEAHVAVLDRADRAPCDRLAVAAGLRHRHEPLVGQHRLDDLPGARAARHHQLVLLGLDQQAERIEVGHDLLARDEAVEAAVRHRCVVVDCGVEREHADDRQLMPLADRVVVRVVRRRDLDDARAELAVDVRIGDHRNRAAAQRQRDLLADERGVALVVGVHHHGGVAEHGLGPGGRHHQRAGAVGQRVADVPEETVFLFAFHFEV